MATSTVKDLRKHLREELDYLAEILGKQDISEADLKRCGNTLHMLLCEKGKGDLQRLADARQERVMVMAPDNKSALATLSPEIEIYMCGGVSVGGVTLWEWIVPDANSGSELVFSGHVMFDGGPADEATHDRAEEQGHQFDQKKLSLKHFRNQICLYSKGHKISRETLIRYVANKRGGKHFDTTRTGNRGPQFSALDKLDIYEIGPTALDPVFYEIMATAKHLIDSPEVQALVGVNE